MAAGEDKRASGVMSHDDAAGAGAGARRALSALVTADAQREATKVLSMQRAQPVDKSGTKQVLVAVDALTGDDTTHGDHTIASDTIAHAARAASGEEAAAHRLMRAGSRRLRATGWLLRPAAVQMAARGEQLGNGRPAAAGPARGAALSRTDRRQRTDRRSDAQQVHASVAAAAAAG